MKKTFKLFLTLALLAVMNLSSVAQNIQMHYDFGRQLYDENATRPEFTTTVEMFRADKWGSTFFFVDMDYANNEVSSAYWEIARELKFWQAPVSLHLEYNGGLNYIKDAYLVGATYGWNAKDFSKGWTFTPSYKYICDNSDPHNFQLTATWYLNMLDGKLSFTGFADFWREKHMDGEGNAHDYTFIAEPQLWLNFNRFKWADKDFNLSVGTEVELSNNFALFDGFYAIPTLAVKWEF